MVLEVSRQSDVSISTNFFEPNELENATLSLNDSTLAFTGYFAPFMDFLEGVTPTSVFDRVYDPCVKNLVTVTVYANVTVPLYPSANPVPDGASCTAYTSGTTVVNSNVSNASSPSRHLDTISCLPGRRAAIKFCGLCRVSTF